MPSIAARRSASIVSCGKRGERLGDLERAVEVLARRSTSSLTRPMRERLVGLDHPPGEDHVQRAAEADDPRQALGAAVDQRHAPAALGEAERASPRVAMRRSHHSASSRPPARHQPRSRRSSAWTGCRRVKPSGPSGASPRPSVSSALRSAPAQKASSPAPVRTRTRASSSASKRSIALAQQLRRRPVDGVAALGPVDRQDSRGAVAFVSHLIGHVGASTYGAVVELSTSVRPGLGRGGAG